ncbi:MAG: preprotein translocase subunit SecG [Bdellovibrionales bacterium]|nr:preprotein translocase subunit SecG [Bdellovibrionales bacterium]
MLTFITIVHLFVAVILVIFVLLQDSKGGAAGVFGGGSGANSVFGSAGGADFLTKMTRYTAITFALTCIGLAYLTSKPQKSLMDNYVPPASESLTPPSTDAGNSAVQNTEGSSETSAQQAPSEEAAKEKNSESSPSPTPREAKQ